MNFLKKNYKYIILLIVILVLALMAFLLNPIRSNDNLANVGSSLASSTSSSGLECTKTLFVLVEGATSGEPPEEDWFVTVAENLIIETFGDYKESGLYDVIKIRNSHDGFPSFIETNGEELVDRIDSYFLDPNRNKEDYKIVMAGHSAGAMAIWLYKDELGLDSANVEHVYFDSPYNIPDWPGDDFFTRHVLRFTDLVNIHTASEQGIQDDPYHFSWTNGLAPNWGNILSLSNPFSHPRHVIFREDKYYLEPITVVMEILYEEGEMCLDENEVIDFSDCNYSIEGASYSLVDEELTLICNSVEYKFCPIDWDMWIDFTLSSSMIQYYEDNLAGSYECY